MTDEQRKLVDELISHAVQGYEGGDMDDPQLLRASMAASSLAIAIMLREMLDKPQAKPRPWKCVACSITYRNGEPACPCGTQRPRP